MRPFSDQAMKGNVTEAEAKAELLQWVWGPFNFERLVVISLIIQFILFFGAPFRKSTANTKVLTLIWSAYLLADWLSYYSIGLILNGETGRDTNHLHVLWGSLLLAHLCGPDTISVIDMEDHHLWSRTALKFGTIAYSIARITSKTFTQKEVHRSSAPELRRSSDISHSQAHSLLYVPTLALFMVGVAKSLEKIATLLFNRTTVFQDRVVRKIDDPTKASLVQGAVLVKAVEAPEITAGSEELKPFEALRDAYRLFTVFKGCFVDFELEFDNDGGRLIREYFLDRTPQDAFRVVETELNLVYDVFYTKTGHFDMLGVRFVRYMTVIAEFVAVGCLATEQVNDLSNWFDVPITHALIFGALVMDTIAALRMVFSIRAIVPSDDAFRGWVLNKLLSLQRRSWGGYSSRTMTPYLDRARRVLFRRWSESISQFNLVDYCLRRNPRWLQNVYHFIGHKEKVHQGTYTDRVWFTDSLRDFVFEELKDKANLLRNHDSMLFGWITERELDKCLLIWHIATDLLLNESDDDGAMHLERQWSKTLSDYMLYLLIQHPEMLKQPELGLMGRIRLESADKSCEKPEMSSTPSYCSWLQRRISIYATGWLSKRHDEAPRRAMLEKMKNNPRDEVVIEGNRLARRLVDMGGQKWEVASKVWVELLCRTASETKPSAHIKTLNRGGELVTLVWLLMNHLGISDRERQPEPETPRIIAP